MSDVVYVVTTMSGGYAREDHPTCHVEGVHTTASRAIAHSKGCCGSVHIVTLDAIPPGTLEYMRELGIKNV